MSRVSTLHGVSDGQLFPQNTTALLSFEQAVNVKINNKTKEIIIIAFKLQ
jgi:hypothetical protein